LISRNGSSVHSSQLPSATQRTRTLGRRRRGTANARDPLEAVELLVEDVVGLGDAPGRLTQQRELDAVFVDELLVGVGRPGRAPTA